MRTLKYRFGDAWPMKRIVSIMTGDELLDKAFRKAKKIRVTDLEGGKRARAEAMGKLNSSANTLSGVLRKYVKAFPSLDRLHPFERELIDLAVGMDELRHSLGAIDWAAKTIDHVRADQTTAMKRSGTGRASQTILMAAYGRISSVIKKVDRDLKFLIEARERLKEMPDINPENPVVVIAGAPNVGKSSLVRGISTGKPEVATYPFTTKGVSIGHMEMNYQIYQVMDTPGILDRPLEKRNKMELQALAALKHIADLIVFVFDPSETCGYPLAGQKALLEELRKEFRDSVIIVVSNKSDLARPIEGLAISTLTGSGLDELKILIRTSLKKEN